MLVKRNLDSEFGAMIGDTGTKVLGLGVIAYKDGKQVYNFFGGRRRVDPDKPVTKNTLFRAASLSKMFTAFSIMQLVERKKLSLSDDVSDYLGFELRNPHFPDAPITIEMLADHTSSLRDGKIYSLPPHCALKEFFTPEGVAYEDGAHFAAKIPGKYFDYCNLNYGVLGTVIERVTGERFDLYQQENILKPLEISGGYVVSNFDAQIFSELGTLYQKKFDKWIPQLDNYNLQPPENSISVQNPYAPDAYGSYSLTNYKIGTNATIFSPQGGLRLSFTDLSHFLEMIINRGTFKGKKIISESSFDTIISTHWAYDTKFNNGNTFGGVMENYGLATYKIGGSSKARLCKNFLIDLIGHSGEAFGLISGLYFAPDTRDGVIFMINGTAISVDDVRSSGNFSANYIWEENVVNPVCNYIFAKN